jgi:hypothetical protein
MQATFSKASETLAARFIEACVEDLARRLRNKVDSPNTE